MSSDTETPSGRLVAAALEMCEVTDGQGRRIAVRRLTALDKLRLFKAAGPALAQNQPWLGMAVLAASVVAIDDVPVPSPTTEAQVEALVSRLGDHGIAAVAGAFATVAAAPADLAATAGN